MIACALPPLCADAAAPSALTEHLLRHVDTLVLSGSGIRWHRWGEGPPLVLLHGWGSDWREWQLNIEHLATRFQVLVANLPLPLTAQDAKVQDMYAWASVIRQDLCHLYPTARLSVVGQGWGSVVAGILAPALPQLSSLVLLGGARPGASAHPAGLQPDWASALLRQHWADFHAPLLMICGASKENTSSSDTAINLARGHDEREWMVLPSASYPLQQACAKEVNMVLTHWLLSHG